MIVKVLLELRARSCSSSSTFSSSSMREFLVVFSERFAALRPCVKALRGIAPLRRVLAQLSGANERGLYDVGGSEVAVVGAVAALDLQRRM